MSYYYDTDIPSTDILELLRGLDDLFPDKSRPSLIDLCPSEPLIFSGFDFSVSVRRLLLPIPDKFSGLLPVFWFAPNCIQFHCFINRLGRFQYVTRTGIFPAMAIRLLLRS